MLAGTWLYVVAVAASFAIATLASPAGVSGAVLLLPFQVSVLGTPSPAVTPTNLLYNVVATPGALYRYRRQGQTGGALTRVLVVGTLPGVIAGSIIRVELLPGTRPFELVIVLVLVPLGGSLVARKKSQDAALPVDRLALGATTRNGRSGRRVRRWDLRHRRRFSPRPSPHAFRAPTCRGGACHPRRHVGDLDRGCRHVSRSLHTASRIDRSATGCRPCTRGRRTRGGYLGARLQPRLAEVTIRRLLGFLVIAVGIRYGWLGLR